MAADIRATLQEWQESLAPPTCKVAKLTDKNYFRWKREMSMHLKAAGLWSVVSDDVPAVRDAAWSRRNDRAWNDIYGACDPDQQEFIFDYDFAKQAWDRLQALYESHDPATIQRLYGEWNVVRKLPTESMAHFIARVKSMARRLTGSGETVSTTNLINKIIGGLDQSYDTLKISLSLVHDLTEDRLTQALLNEESRRQALFFEAENARKQAFHRDQSRRMFEENIRDQRGRPGNGRSHEEPHLPRTRRRDRERSVSPEADDLVSKRDRKGGSSKYCEACKVWGHSEDNCYFLHPELLAFRRNRAPPPPHGTQPQPAQVMAMTQHAPANSSPPAPQENGNAPAGYVPPSSGFHAPTGYAMHMQSGLDATHFDYDAVWDYYDHAMVMASVDNEAIQSLHRYNTPIGFPESGGTATTAVPSLFPVKSIPSEGDYVQVPKCGNWLIDSGASNHYTAMRHILSEFHSTPDVTIQTGSGFVVGKGIGNVTIHSSVGVRKIHDVIWVPMLAGQSSLLSIPQLTRKGCMVTMMGLNAAIYSDSSERILLLEGIFRGKGYFIKMGLCDQTMHLAKLVSRRLSPVGSILVPTPMLDEFSLTGRPLSASAHELAMMAGMKTSAYELAMMAGVEDTQPLEVWHLRLGHLNQSAIQQLTTRASGMIIGPARPQTVSMNCEACLRGSQHKNISHARGHPAKKKLEHVWADVKGPLLDRDIYGFRYFVVFLDEFTRYTFELPMIDRGQLCNAYKLFEARAERVSGCSVLHLHADGEFIGDDLRLHLRNRGIELCLTQPYAPQMNGLAERVIRTVIEHASAMLWAAGLPIGFWSSAVKCAVFLANRSPHSALPDSITPFEAWFGGQPNLGFLRVFGCRAVAHVPDELRRKVNWTSKSSPSCIFIGYSDTENLFELWDVDKSVVLRKRDVVFWEHELGHPKLTSPLPHGVSILPAIASELVQAVADTPLQDVSRPIRSSAPSVPMPLLPRTGRQSIDSLTAEPTIQQRAQSGSLQFVAEPLPADIATKVANIRTNHPQPRTFQFVNSSEQDLRYMDASFPVDDIAARIAASFSVEDVTSHYFHFIDVLDDRYMETYLRDTWLEPDTAIDVVLGDFSPTEAYQISPSSESIKPLYVPQIDTDLPQKYKQAMSHPRCEMWKAAMDRELDALKRASTWDIVDLTNGRRAFPNRWVFAYIRGPKVADYQEQLWKEQQGSLMHDQIEQRAIISKSQDAVIGKARLVARGDLQNEGLDYAQTYAPMVKFVSLRIILTWAARKHLKTRRWDIVSAFLHGDIDMVVYMQQPQGFSDGSNRVCLLKKAIYGLHQSARQFYIKLDSVLRDIGYVQLGGDWAIWMNRDTGAMIAAHVDDMTACGPEEQLEEAKYKIGLVLGVKDLGDITRYLNITCTYDAATAQFYLSQPDDIKRLLEEYGMQQAYEVSTPALHSDKDCWESKELPLLDD